MQLFILDSAHERLVVCRGAELQDQGYNGGIVVTFLSPPPCAVELKSCFLASEVLLWWPVMTPEVYIVVSLNSWKNVRKKINVFKHSSVLQAFKVIQNSVVGALDLTWYISVVLRIQMSVLQIQKHN